jgi:hypothetical protein
VKLPALLLLLTVGTLTPLRAWAEERDILDSLKGHELGILVQDPQSHQFVSVKYGDPHLAKAEQILSDIPRPWTVPKMIDTFKKEREEWRRKIAALPPDKESIQLHIQWEDRCESLARVLAASRDPRAAVALAEAFEKSSGPEQVSEMEAMFYYFVSDYYYGLPANAGAHHACGQTLVERQQSEINKRSGGARKPWINGEVGGWPNQVMERTADRCALHF